VTGRTQNPRSPLSHKEKFFCVDQNDLNLSYALRLILGKGKIASVVEKQQRGTHTDREDVSIN